MKAVALNMPALWRPIRATEFSVRKYTNAYPFQTDNGTLGQASSTKPVTRYAKNFKKYGLDFSLFIFSDETNQSLIEKFLTSVVATISKKDISEVLKTASMSNFKYLDKQYEAKK